MTTVRVTVEMTVNGLPDKEARELAREIVERRGLTPVSATVKKAPDSDQAKPLLFKRDQPGALFARGGRRWQVWAQAPVYLRGRDCVWAVPVDRKSSDAPVYLIDLRYGDIVPYTGSGGHAVDLYRSPLAQARRDARRGRLREARQKRALVQELAKAASANLAYSQEYNDRRNAAGSAA